MISQKQGFQLNNSDPNSIKCAIVPIPPYYPHETTHGQHFKQSESSSLGIFEYKMSNIENFGSCWLIGNFENKKLDNPSSLLCKFKLN
jgi:hypothetical protein